MSVNPTTPVYGTNNPDHYLAVMDVDVRAANPNDPTNLGSSAKAQVTINGGTLNADGTVTPGQSPVTVTPQALPAGTNDSAAVATADGILIAANPARIGGYIQNTGVNNVGISEFGAAVIGGLGTFTLAPGATYQIRTSNAIHAIAAVAANNVTAVVW